MITLDSCHLKMFFVVLVSVFEQSRGINLGGLWEGFCFLIFGNLESVIASICLPHLLNMMNREFKM